MRESQWARLSDVLGERIGLYYPRERWGDLERGIAAAARMFGKDTGACVDWLLAAPWSRHQIEVLASCLTIGETYFFRERRSFEVLRDEILPDLLRARRASERRLRIWSAGCCTGEEPYSIAMLLASTIPDLRDWNISILATDIDPVFLRKASMGGYGSWSFRDSPPGIRERYFKETSEGRFAIAPYIREMVTFSYLNLAELDYPSIANGTNAMDIVFCRNVLMYFDPARAAQVLQRLGCALLEGGWLFINPVEMPHTTLPQLELVRFDDVLLHRKTSAEVPALRVPVSTSRDIPAVPTGIPPTWIVEAAPVPEPALEYPPQIEIVAAPHTPPPGTPLPSLHEAAEAAYREGRYAQAVQASLDILANAPNDTTAMALLAKTYANQGRLAQALQCCEKAVAAEKLNAQWRYLKATILQELGELEEAADEVRCALYLEPESPLLHFSLGNLLRRQGLAEDARRHFRNALALLESYAPDQLVPESDGLSAGRLTDIIRMTIAQESEP